MEYLSPDDIPDIPIYDDFKSCDEISLKNNKIKVLEGVIDYVSCNGSSKFAKLPSIVSRDEVQSILDMVKNMKFNTDPDSVDGMSTHEMYIDLDSDSNSNMNINMNINMNKLREIVLSILNSRITPYVRYRYPKTNDRLCTPSHCLIRRYRNGERLTHRTHKDGHAYSTVVISLSDYEKEYRGGIYVASAERYKQFIPLNRGDAIIHKYDLLHGVNVKDDGGERWSCILWYKDSITGKDFSSEWFKDKAYSGNAIYQSLYANVVSEKDKIFWLKKAAEQGHANSMIKLARAYMKILESDYFEFNPEEAYRLYNNAIATAQDPNAQYELAALVLTGLKKKSIFMMDILNETIKLLEEAAKGGHVYAMFNLGIAHLYGYTGNQNIELATKWFKASGLPEGLVATSMYYDSIRDSVTSIKLKENAYKLGYKTQWRKLARIHSGFGGTSGVDINLPWPTMPSGNKPVEW